MAGWPTLLAAQFPMFAVDIPTCSDNFWRSPGKLPQLWKSHHLEKVNHLFNLFGQFLHIFTIAM
jgi:hypothetical protein